MSRRKLVTASEVKRTFSRHAGGAASCATLTMRTFMFAAGRRANGSWPCSGGSTASCAWRSTRPKARWPASSAANTWATVSGRPGRRGQAEGGPPDRGEQPPLGAQQWDAPQGVAEPEMGRPDLNSPNRPVRTRMPGGVAGERSLCRFSYSMTILGAWEVASLFSRSCQIASAIFL